MPLSTALDVYPLDRLLDDPQFITVNTIRAAMRPAWGNTFGLKFRAIGEKGANLFVAEFGSKADMERILAGAP